MRVDPFEHPLDNPFWSALGSIHADVALGSGEVRRYPADMAPFLGVAHAGVDMGAALDALGPAGDSVLLLGVAPQRMPAGWMLEAFADLAQLQCDHQLELIDGPQIIELDERHRADVLALTALVYPHYFRPRTMDLGRYFGIFVDGRLAAMIGERLGTFGHREMSAICTHPDFVGRGYARRLTAWLVNDTLQRGCVPFLHVAHANTRARRLYEQTGWRLRRDIGFWALRRG
jgi:ribosomal protein S18 acetylase RimI-like enzyme